MAPWEGSMTWCGGVATSAKGEVAPRREKRPHYASWTETNLIGLKIKKIHAVDSAAINGR